MKIFHVSPIKFENWDFRTPDETGIGGSETAVVELAWRQAARGHDVTVYAPIRPDCPERDRGGARWLPLEAADYSQPGLWVLHRCPGVVDNLTRDDQQSWLMCQDVFYPHVLRNGQVLKDGLTPERAKKITRVLPLCSAQDRYMVEEMPELAGKTTISSNGLRVDLIEEIENEVLGLQHSGDSRGGNLSGGGGELPGGRHSPEGDTREDSRSGVQPVSGGIVRDPFRLIYTSSPDRGLPTLLKIFKRAKELEPRLTLAAAYGFDNIRKCEGKYWVNVRKECEKLMEQPGVTWLGRLPQKEEYRQVLSSGLWAYSTVFTETSCCACMIAQGCGAIPITNPLWALADNVRHGVFLQGNPADEPLVRAQYVGEILRLTGDLDLQERIRASMIPWARKKFDWERVVDAWEEMAREDLIKTTEKVTVPVACTPADKVLSAPGHPDWVVREYQMHPEAKPLVDRQPAEHLNCSIVVTSVDRVAVSDSPNHIDACLRGIGKKYCVAVMPDCPSADYVPLCSNVEVYRWPEWLLARQDRLTKGKRAGFNYCRCLEHDRTRDALILEDDCVLAEGWEQKILAALARIPEERFILAVWHCWDWTFATQPIENVTRFANMLTTIGDDPTERLWTWAGTNAVYYPASVMAMDLPEFIRRCQEERPNDDSTLYDGMVGAWCFQNKVPVYLMTPPAAVNVGSITAIEWDKGLREKREVMV